MQFLLAEAGLGRRSKAEVAALAELAELAALGGKRIKERS